MRDLRAGAFSARGAAHSRQNREVSLLGVPQLLHVFMSPGFYTKKDPAGRGRFTCREGEGLPSLRLRLYETKW